VPFFHFTVIEAESLDVPFLANLFCLEIGAFQCFLLCGGCLSIVFIGLEFEVLTLFVFWTTAVAFCFFFSFSFSIGVFVRKCLLAGCYMMFDVVHFEMR
jgi:hypothetical protein